MEDETRYKGQSTRRIYNLKQGQSVYFNMDKLSEMMLVT